MAGKHFVGTSGWIYKHWDDVFYPRQMPPAERLTYYAQHFATVEVNYSFYKLPSREVFEGWRQATPPEFVFAVKASRYLTHRKKLKDPVEPLQRLFDAATGLEEKLGPLLFQFPAQWAKNFDRLADFLALLPAGRRCAFEFRHPSWLSADVYHALERHNCALCIPDHPEMPQGLRDAGPCVTAAFSYIRFHSGPSGPNYLPRELASWATKLRGMLERGIDVYAYFNNDVAGYAVNNARSLAALLEE